MNDQRILSVMSSFTASIPLKHGGTAVLGTSFPPGPHVSEHGHEQKNIAGIKVCQSLGISDW